MWKKVIGWILFGLGILDAVYALATNPIHLLYESPAIIASSVGGWILAHRKQKSNHFKGIK